MNEFIAPTIDWFRLSPVIIVLGAGVIGVVLEALLPRRGRRMVQLVYSLTALAASAVCIVLLWTSKSGPGVAIKPSMSGESFFGTVVIDKPALFLQGSIVVLAFFAVLLIGERTSTKEDAFAPQASSAPGTPYEESVRRAGYVQTEVFPLMLFSIGGMMVFVAASDLLTLFVALEVLSLPLYLLCGMARRRRLLSQEASMKYFLLGAFASALMLFGSALLYGFAGTVNFTGIAEAIGTVTGMDGILLAGGVLLIVGMLFKLGAVPFHSWMPDVYQGAPTPVTAFMAACTKVAAAGALLRVLYVALPALEWDWRPAMWAVVILTMLVGAVLAVVQTDVKRMLAYSSIAHAGFILAGLISLSVQGVAAVLFYLPAYGITTLGAFAVVYLVREKDSSGAITAEATHLSQWAGLGKRSPLLAGVFSFFLLAFAGIPLTSGFIGKFAVFGAAAGSDGIWLVIVGVLASAIAAFFYVRLIVLMYFTPPAGSTAVSTPADVPANMAYAMAGAGTAGDADTETGAGSLAATAEPADGSEAAPAATTSSVTVVRSSGPAAVVIAVAAIATLVLGVLPGPLLELATRAAAMFIP